jgi:hypothetical protein
MQLVFLMYHLGLLLDKSIGMFSNVNYKLLLFDLAAATQRGSQRVVLREQFYRPTNFEFLNLLDARSTFEFRFRMSRIDNAEEVLVHSRTIVVDNEWCVECRNQYNTEYFKYRMPTRIAVLVEYLIVTFADFRLLSGRFVAGSIF